MAKKLECRIVLGFRRADQKTEVGMYDPISGRYEPLGAHGPAATVVDKVVHDLKRAIEGAGHRLTFCEREV
jgi:hypothetical protein